MHTTERLTHIHPTKADHTVTSPFTRANDHRRSHGTFSRQCSKSTPGRDRCASRPVGGGSNVPVIVPLAACQSPTKAASDWPMRGGRCMSRPHLFPRELPGRMLAGGLASSREHENTSRERCGSIAGSSHLRFFTIGRHGRA